MKPTETTLLLPIDIDGASDLATDIRPLTWLAEINSLEAEWSRARDAWLATQRSENTRRAYRVALNDFFDTTSAAPWAVDADAVRDWLASMRAAGRSASTIGQRLAACSSFYNFVCTQYLPTNGGNLFAPLCQFNPFLAIERPKLLACRKASCLSAEQASALLSAIPSDTLQGQRDYAMFLTYLSTGRRNSEVRLLKWGDIVERHGRVHYRWTGNGEDRSDELPRETWTAIKAYLQAAGRLETMSEGEYIFTALTDRATRLKNVDAITWNPLAHPLSAREVGRLLKRYARLAGLDSKQIRVSTLRYTAARLRHDAGDDVEAICEFLNLSSLNATRRYLGRIKSDVGETWTKVADMLQLNRIQKRRTPRPTPMPQNPNSRRGRYTYGHQP